MIYYEGPILKIVIWVKGSQSYYLGTLKRKYFEKKIQKAFNTSSSEYLNQNETYS